MKIFKLVLSTAILGFLEAKVIPGNCPSVTTKLDFEPALYLGDWYQQQGTRTFYIPEEANCIKATYGDNDDGSISVHNIVSRPMPAWMTVETCGYATETDVGGILELHFPFNSAPGDYEILDTDYDSYACVWSCYPLPLGFSHNELGYILTREQEFSQDIVDICLAKFKEQKLDIMADGLITFYSGSNCSYEVTVPEPNCQ